MIFSWMGEMSNLVRGNFMQIMKITHSLKIAFPALTLTLGLASASFGAVGEKIELKSAPAAAQSAIKAKAGDKSISAVEKKTKGDKITYAATVKGSDGKASIITVDPEGKLVNVKEDVKMKDLPAAVQAAIKDKAGDKTVSAIEKKIKGDKATYIATAKSSDGKAVLITVDSDGKVLKAVDAKKDAATAAKPKTK